MTRKTVYFRALFCAFAAMLANGCISDSLVSVTTPQTIVDPSVVSTPAGATQLYNNAVTSWSKGVGGSAQTSGITSFVFATAMWTDELLHVQGSFSSQSFVLRLDERINNAVTDANFFSFYSLFVGIRTTAQLAREALQLYAPNTPRAWQARLMAQEGFGVVYLAEMFCSGIPLSTVHLQGEPTLTSGFTTQDALDQAVALFDSAVTLAGDSTRFKNLALVGKGRALLDEGKFAQAAAAVSTVPTDFVYNLGFSGLTGSFGQNYIGNNPVSMQVRDKEGGNGLTWTTDPRTAIVTVPNLSGAMPVPGKYSYVNGVINAGAVVPDNPIRAADGLEARLIEAEAALATGDASWLSKLNSLRATCIGTAACAPVLGLTASNVPANLTDPGTPDSRLDLLMKERAMWLYLTGHREGDLRRLAHVYKRDPATLWPVGLYVNPGFPPLIAASVDNGSASYGTTFLWNPNVGLQESLTNPQYSGCVDLNP